MGFDTYKIFSDLCNALSNYLIILMSLEYTYMICVIYMIYFDE